VKPQLAHLEDPTGYHSSPLQIGKRGYNLLEHTKIEEWKNVAWSNESRFLLRHSYGRVRLWCKQNENMDPSCLVTTVQAGGGGGVMMCSDVFLAHFRPQ